MFGEEKNLKDSHKNSFRDTSLPTLNMAEDFHLRSIRLSYTRTNKLVTALYMVTDILDKDEPLRSKLRTLGAGIVSDTYLIESTNGQTESLSARNRISEIMSFLSIATDLNIISEMNSSILRREFMELDHSIKETLEGVKTFHQPLNLAEFFRENLPVSERRTSQTKYQSIGHGPTRIGVQRGSTLMKALSDRTKHMSDRKLKNIKDFGALKTSRRQDIINSIRKNSGSATITDIKTKAEGSLVSCGEKTLQRELVSMVKDGVLNKTGDKRWSRYFLKS